MRLTPRLQAIAELIPPAALLDIGTDHAYPPALPIAGADLPAGGCH